MDIILHSTIPSTFRHGHDKGRTWKVIKETFEKDCGYDVYFQVLNAKD